MKADLCELKASLFYKSYLQDRLQSYGETLSRKPNQKKNSNVVNIFWFILQILIGSVCFFPLVLCIGENNMVVKCVCIYIFTYAYVSVLKVQWCAGCGHVHRQYSNSKMINIIKWNYTLKISFSHPRCPILPNNIVFNVKEYP